MPPSSYRPYESTKDWQSPSFARDPAYRLGFCQDMKREGERWIESQSSYKDIPKAIDAITGNINIRVSETRSGINTARLKRDNREIISTLANIRPFWGYSSDAKFFSPSALMMNKVARAVYLENFFDRALKGALQYASMTGDGYVWPKYSRTMYGRGPGSIHFDYLGALDVLPVQMPRNNNLQEAYIVTISDIVPVAKAHSMFPLFQSQLKPIARRKYRGSSASTDRKLTLADRLKFGSRTDKFLELYCEIDYMYILDSAINTTGNLLPMGQKGTSWYYEVPSVGMEIRQHDPLTGQAIVRAARPEDCYIYPYRRLMTFSDDVLLYDGPNWDWHGMVPLLRFSFDRWVTEGLGLILLKDGYEYQAAINQLERAAQTVANSRLRPGLTYDTSGGANINTQTAEGMDPFAPDLRVGVDNSGGGEGRAFDTILPENLLEVPAWFFTLMEHYNNGMDYQLGLKDITALAKLRANADANALDKILEVMGPIVQDISRDMEQTMRDAGDITKYLILQYMTTQRIMQYVGEDGITPETIDYDPNSIIPSHMPFEADRMNAGKESTLSKIERARHFAGNLRFTITPYSLHEITQMAVKLAYVQLKKVGVWISNQTIASAWNIPNYGTVDGATEIEKYWNEKGIELKHMVQLQKAMEGLQMGGTVPGAGGAGAGAGTGATTAAATGSASDTATGNPEGRPSTFSAPPKLKTKGDGRTTIATSA